MRESKTTSKESFAANRYLLEKGWEAKKSERGRPSKEEIRRTAIDIVSSDKSITEDLNRIQGLSPVSFQRIS